MSPRQHFSKSLLKNLGFDDNSFFAPSDHSSDYSSDSSTKDNCDETDDYLSPTFPAKGDCVLSTYQKNIELLSKINNLEDEINKIFNQIIAISNEVDLIILKYKK